jgi:Protein of unknown function (DUF1524)
VARYYALREIERLLHQPRAEHIEILSALSIEHVMPEEWMEQWLLPNGNRGVTLFERFDDSRATEDVEATEKRDRAKHTIGNLTLLTQPLNSSVSNSAFEIKKPEIVRNSALALNRYFHEPECWDETNITERGRLCLLTHFVDGLIPIPHAMNTYIGPGMSPRAFGASINRSKTSLMKLPPPQSGHSNRAFNLLATAARGGATRCGPLRQD